MGNKIAVYKALKCESYKRLAEIIEYYEKHGALFMEKLFYKEMIENKCLEITIKAPLAILIHIANSLGAAGIICICKSVSDAFIVPEDVSEKIQKAHFGERYLPNCQLY